MVQLPNLDFPPLIVLVPCCESCKYRVHGVERVQDGVIPVQWCKVNYWTETPDTKDFYVCRHYVERPQIQWEVV